MSDLDPIPNSISHKKLNSFIRTACKDSVFERSTDNELSNHQIEFNELTTSWSKLSKKILFHLSQSKNNLAEGKSPTSLMALGAMEVHINMAIQALKASEID